MDRVKEAFKEYPQVFAWLIAGIFVMGGMYFEFQLFQAEQDKFESRLDKKIKIINSHDERLDIIEEYISYEKGYNQCKKDLKK